MMKGDYHISKRQERKENYIKQQRKRLRTQMEMAQKKGKAKRVKNVIKE